MARPQKPWFRTQTGWWMVKVGGVQTKLVKGKESREQAYDAFYKLMAQAPRPPEGATARVADVVEAFLRHSRVHYAEDTYRIYRYYCQLFAEACGQVAAREIRPYHVARWVDPKVAAKEWNETTVYNARRSAFRVFSWAAEQGILGENPLKGLQRPKPRPRQRAITDEEFWQLYEYAGDPLKHLLLALYLTGARPKEVRELKWDQVLENRWVLREHKTAKKVARDRVVVLPKAVSELMAKLRAGATSAYVFLNTYGKPWTMNALRLQISRLRDKLGLSNDVCAYLIRHGFGTRAVLNGVDGKTLAELMGHTSTEMINRVYVHLADQHQHLSDAAEKVNASVAMPPPDAGRPTRKRARPVPKKGKKAKRKK